MLPLQLLNGAVKTVVLVELKNGETYNGHLISCDNWMNINLTNVVSTSAGDEKIFTKMPELYIRGNTIKYLRIQDEVLDVIAKEQEKMAAQGSSRGRGYTIGGGGRGQRGRGGRGGRGRGK